MVLLLGRRAGSIPAARESQPRGLPSTAGVRCSTACKRLARSRHRTRSPLCGALHQISAEIVPMQRNSGQPVPGTRRFARVRVTTLTLLVVFISPAPAAAAWRLPVSGPVSRAVRSRPRTRTRAATTAASTSPPRRGRPSVRRVRGGWSVAGRVGSSGGVVTVLCGHWRATLLPLSTISARRGGSVSAGTSVGTLARSGAHAGLHLGVRRDGVRFGYVDPLRFLAPSRPGAPPLGRAPRGRPRAPARRRRSSAPLDASPRARAAAAPPSRAVARVGRSRARAGRPRLSLAPAPVARTAAGWGGGGVGRCG